MYLLIIFSIIIIAILGFYFTKTKEKFKVTPRIPVPVCNGHGTINETKSIPGKPLICDCDQGWSGNTCDVKLNENPQCNNRGVVIVGRTPTECACDAGWEGKLCEIPNCNSNGTFDNHKNICVCKDGYFGPECQYSRKDTCSNNGDVIDDSGNCKCDTQKYYYFPSKDDCNNKKDCDQYFTEVPLFQGYDCFNPIDISVDPINNDPANPPIKSYKNLYNLDSAGNPIFPYANQEGLKTGVKQSSLLGQDAGTNNDEDYVKICPFNKTISIDDDIVCTPRGAPMPIYGDITYGTVLNQEDPNGCRTILNGYKAISSKLPKEVNDYFLRPFDIFRTGTECKFSTTDKDGNKQNLIIRRTPPKDKDHIIKLNPNPDPVDPSELYNSAKYSSPWLEGTDNYYKENGSYYYSPLSVTAWNLANPSNPYEPQKSAYVVIGNKIKNDDICNNHGHYNLESQSCICKNGWKGVSCDQIDVKCVNGNIEENSSDVNFGICICNDGWSGPACDNKIPPKITNCTPGGDCSESQQKCSLADKDYVCYNGKWTENSKSCINQTCDIEGQLCADPTPGSYGGNYICRNGMWTDIAFDCQPGTYCSSNGQLCLKPPGSGLKQYVCNNNKWQEVVESCNGWDCAPLDEGKVCLKGSPGASDTDYICEHKIYNAPFVDYKWVEKGNLTSFKQCPPKCTINGTCDPDTGQCKCKSGYSGADCSFKTCLNDCSGNGKCDITTGKCTCNPGYSGDNCSVIVCVPNCAGKNCGSDGCGGSCGTCVYPNPCNADGTCCVPNCTPNCGQANGCGGWCTGVPSLEYLPPGGMTFIDSKGRKLLATYQDELFLSTSDNIFGMYLSETTGGYFTVKAVTLEGVLIHDPTLFPIKSLSRDLLDNKVIYYSEDKKYWIRPEICM